MGIDEVITWLNQLHPDQYIAALTFGFLATIEIIGLFLRLFCLCIQKHYERQESHEWMPSRDGSRRWRERGEFFIPVRREIRFWAVILFFWISVPLWAMPGSWNELSASNKQILFPCFVVMLGIMLWYEIGLRRWQDIQTWQPSGWDAIRAVGDQKIAVRESMQFRTKLAVVATIALLFLWSGLYHKQFPS